MSIKDKIKGAFSKRITAEDPSTGEDIPYQRSSNPSRLGPKRKPGAKFSYEEVTEPKRGTRYSPEDEADIEARARQHQEELRKNIRYQTEGKSPRKLSPEEERLIAEEARAASEGNREEILSRIREEQEAIRQGVPLTESKLVWTDVPGQKKQKQVLKEFTIPGYARKIIAGQTKEEVARAIRAEELHRQETAKLQRLSPMEARIEEQQLGMMQGELSHLKKTQPIAHKLNQWEWEKAQQDMKKEQFARTKRGKVLNIAGKTFDKGISGLAGGMGGAAMGMGMALRSGPSVDTAIYTGRFNPRNVNMQTPASQTHGQTWIQAGRALTPTSKSPAGRALGMTNVPAGMAMMPNLKNLNPAISFRPMGLGLNSSRLSPLPRRRQPPQQTEPGASRVR